MHGFDLINHVTGNNFNNLFVIIRHGATSNTTYETVAQARDDGAVTFNYGNFLQTVINFFFIAFTLYWIVKGTVSHCNGVVFTSFVR